MRSWSGNPAGPHRRVNLENIAAYFKAGACAVGVGNNLMDQEALAAGRQGDVVAREAAFLQVGYAAKKR